MEKCGNCHKPIRLLHGDYWVHDRELSGSAYCTQRNGPSLEAPQARKMSQKDYWIEFKNTYANYTKGGS